MSSTGKIVNAINAGEKVEFTETRFPKKICKRALARS